MNIDDKKPTVTPIRPLVASSPTDAEHKTLRAWLDENDPPPGMVSDVCTMRALVALGCTIKGLDPGTAARHLVTRTELVEMMSEAKAKHVETLTAEGNIEEHVAPIIPAKSLLCAMIIKRPSPGQLNTLNEAVLEASQAGTEDRKGLRLSMLTQMLRGCALYPDVLQRQKWFVSYGDLALEFAGKCKALGSQAAEEVVGK